LTSAGLFS